MNKYSDLGRRPPSKNPLLSQRPKTAASSPIPRTHIRNSSMRDIPIYIQKPSDFVNFKINSPALSPISVRDAWEIQSPDDSQYSLHVNYPNRPRTSSMSSLAIKENLRVSQN